ncbi:MULTISPECIES: acetyl-CoA carboxylase biotin carboxyl carrier protein [unclassified Clostridium]|uniref:acetyl-CoA carboxylase biotin carboxyl carrier protein n=1 Tax=Clostridium TaxID=1485 RepID=UPI0021AB262F|nr:MULTISPECIES: acetyl-CoA carboxylase biotin carboxyl carrier protein [unclassified Clostridium]MDU2289458.1 acetyl-CoA carboxylase biotin carboxyl carrier protein [Clostridium celatum]MDU4326296.1 acetyl-CoA carboxylase biotin carboxyl carrier protein [Clostridium celatum]
MLDYNQIKELIKEIDSSSLRVFELENNDIKLKLSKNEENYLYKENDVNINKTENSKTFIKSSESLSEEALVEKEEVIEEDLAIVKSPLVGTYYSSSTPGGTPYVEIGSKVKKGDVLCIVEAMKIMNEITSEVDGEIVEALRSDEEIVEFGMELFKIRS